MIERLTTHLVTSHFYPARHETNLLPPAKEQDDITKFYNVENEVRFLQKYANNLTPEERNHYLQENILGCLCEFAGGIPHRKITFLLGDKGLCYGDIRMIDMLQNTTNLAGSGSRAGQENIGQTLVYNEFERHYRESKSLKHAAIISPPKDWDYGYLFYYSTEFDADLDREVVRLHAIEYKEARHEIQNSQNILLRINPQLFYRDAREFLEVPILDLIQTPDLDSVLKAAGVSQQDLDYSRWFEDAVIRDEIIAPALSRYIHLVTDLAADPNYSYREDRLIKLDEMDSLLRGMYNRAKEIKERYGNGIAKQVSGDKVSNDNASVDYNIPLAGFQQIFARYAAQPAIVVGGGSCPSVSNNGSRGFLSSYQLSEGLSFGNSVESLILGSSSVENSSCSQCGKDNDSHFHCPDCGYTIPSGVGKIICDGCGLTKEKLAARTGVSCG